EKVYKFVDLANRTVILKHYPPERIIVLDSYWAEVLHILGLDDRIVGIGEYVKYDKFLPESVKNKTVIGSMFKGVNWESVITLNPDLFIMDWYGGKYGDKKILEKAESLDIPVACMYIKNIDDNIKAVEFLGDITGEKEKANELVNWMESKLEKIKEIAKTIPKDKRKNVLMITYRKGEVRVYANSPYGQIIEYVGAHNLALDKNFSSPWVKLNLEQIIDYWGNKTDIILVVGYNEKSLNESINEILSSKEWKAIKAVREGHVYGILSGTNGYLSWGPRIVTGVYQIANYIYPEFYPDWRTVRDELLKKFYKINITE
ncbi:ABC transporter substrate-binding protein, partial [Methanocaldococcus infernus]